ncbi:MAG: flagellar biosynthesis protein FliQ [Lachnospiraceae bacterium]|nr:flagellar biosynthesis protein FliQ [Lachnospiraceae bacterium]
MNIEDVTRVTTDAIYTVISTAAPVLLISLTVGLLVSIFQTVTSIQEQTLTFVPKILAIFISIMLLGQWMMNNMSSLMIRLWGDFSVYIR